MSITQVRRKQVADKAVSYAKIQDISAQYKALGRVSAGAGPAEEFDITAFILTLLNDPDQATARATLGILSMALQAASAVAITGGAITGTTIDGVSIKSYVDNLIAGIRWKQPVVAATTTNGTLATAFQNLSTIDGYTMAAGDRILIKDQTTATENGIYIVQSSGAPVRATDADTGNELVSASVVVEQGTVNADKAFTCTNNSITLGSTNIVFVNFSAVLTGALIAANNLSDLTNLGTARTNLGLAAMAVIASVTLTGAVTGTGTSTIATTLAAAIVANSNLANMAQGLVKGRAAGAGTGAPVDLTAAELKTILGLGTPVQEEDLVGTKDSSNASFTIANTPIAGTVRITHNGTRLKSGAGNDFTVSGSNITMLGEHIPDSGDQLFADYSY